MKARRYEVYTPFKEEIPTEFFGPPHITSSGAVLDPPADFIRVAKILEQVLGIYELNRDRDGRFLLKSLIVDKAERGKGVGTWLLRHAIGVTETKGGRSLVLQDLSSKKFFEDFDFQQIGNELVYYLVPD